MPGGHTIMPMPPEDLIESTARRRLRSIRTARGWSIEELSQRSHISASTISRLETGRRKISLEHLVTLARALGTSVDEILAEDLEVDDVVIRPSRDTANGATYWMLNRTDDPTGRVVAKMRVPVVAKSAPPRVHAGRDWFYVLSGTVRLVLGDREHIVEAGQAAEFDTMTPHIISGAGRPAEILTIFDHHGERAHLRTS